MKLRRAKIEDIPALVTLAGIMQKESTFANMDFDEHVFASTLVDCVMDDNRIALVVEDDKGYTYGAFIGLVTNTFFGKDLTASDLGIYVHPAARGEGVSSEMIRAYVEWAKGRGAKRINISNSAGMDDDAFVKIMGAHGFRRAGSMVYREED